MKKTIVSACVSILIVGIFGWIIGINLWSVLSMIISALVFYGVAGSVLVDSWKKWNTLHWDYWLMIALLVSGALVDMMASTWGSYKWTLLGLALIVAGGVEYGIREGLLNRLFKK